MGLNKKVGVANTLQLVIWSLFMRVKNYKKKYSTDILMDVGDATARFEPEDAEATEFTNAAISEHGYSVLYRETLKF